MFQVGYRAATTEPPEPSIARRAWQQLAEAGVTNTQYNLALLLEDRWDPPELDEARRWWTAAAVAGHAGAQQRLEALSAEAD